MLPVDSEEASRTRFVLRVPDLVGPTRAVSSSLYGCITATIRQVDKVLARIRRNHSNVRFDDLRKICDHYFGQPRRRGSHLFYKTHWEGEPLVNIQSVRGMAKPYQVRQVIKAIDKLERESR